MEKENNLFDNFKIIFFGILVSFLVTLISIFILSVILAYTNTSEKIIESVIIFISSFSILIGSVLVLKKIKEKGILYGGILGIVYMVLIYVISSIITKNFSLGFSAITMILLGVISGIIGGILGVNLKN